MIHQGENLKYLLREKGITQKDFAKQLDISRMYLVTFFGKKKLPKKQLPEIEKILGASLNFETASADTAPEPEDNNRQDNIIFVPLYVYGGFLTGYADQIFMNKLQRFFLPGVVGEHYAFEVDGMSMHDFASPGDWVVSRPEEKLENMIKGKPYVLQTTDGLLIKYFDKRDDGHCYFSSQNAKEFPQIKIPLKSIKRVYFVTRLLKKL